MPTIEYKYEKGRKVYWVSEGVPYSENDIAAKINECTIDTVYLIQEGAYQVIKYGVRDVVRSVNVREEFLLESIEKAYIQMYNRLAEQIEIDQEKIDKLKKLRLICMKKGKI